MTSDINMIGVNNYNVGVITTHINVSVNGVNYIRVKVNYTSINSVIRVNSTTNTVNFSDFNDFKDEI